MQTDSRRRLDAWLAAADAVLAAPTITVNYYEEAADLIERCGWRQGIYGSTSAGFCVLGALLHVSGESLGPEKTKWALRTIRGWADALGVSEPHHSGFMSIVRWNDDPARSEDEVLERLRHAAKNGGAR